MPQHRLWSPRVSLGLLQAGQGRAALYTGMPSLTLVEVVNCSPRRWRPMMGMGGQLSHLPAWGRDTEASLLPIFFGGPPYCPAPGGHTSLRLHLMAARDEATLHCLSSCRFYTDLLLPLTSTLPHPFLKRASFSHSIAPPGLFVRVELGHVLHPQFKVAPGR